MKKQVLQVLFFLAVVLAGAQQPKGQLPQTVPYGNYPAAGHYVQSGDAKLYYEVYGAGEPMVLLHGGIMGYIDEMAGFIEQLQTDHLVIAMATRGHGKSEYGQGPITYEMKASDVMAVVDAVTADSVTVLGFSDGAYTGYKVASMYPGRVKKLVAIGAGEQVPGLRKVVFSGGPFDASSEFWQGRKALMPEPERLEAFWKDMEHFYNTMEAGKPLLNSIQCPVLVLSGELDRNAPLMTVVSAYQMIPHAQLAIIPNTGHVVFMENFEAVWACVATFLATE